MHLDERSESPDDTRDTMADDLAPRTMLPPASCAAEAVEIPASPMIAPIKHYDRLLDYWGPPAGPPPPLDAALVPAPRETPPPPADESGQVRLSSRGRKRDAA